MKKNYIVLLLTFLFSGVMVAQDQQKNFINYQGVARNADKALMVSEQMTITIALKFGTATALTTYEESHTITTDANGVFSLLIGNGSSLIGDFNSLPWGSAATFVTVSMNGNEIGTTEMMAVPYAISSGDAKQSAADVPYNNSSSGLVASSTQAAIDELATGGSIDADADPTNEIQLISFDAASNTISLTDGGEITIPSGGTDADADPENELQTLAFDAGTNELSLSDGNSIVIPTGGVDGDGDATNEIQTISFDAASNKISLTDGGEITIPSGGTDADSDPENELQTLAFDAGTNELSLSEGNTIIIPSGGVDGDGDSTNEIQDISLDGTELTISDGSTIDLAPIVPPGGTDNQNLTFDGITNILEIEDGNTVDLSSLAGGGSSSSGLETIEEGLGFGWRLIGRNPSNFGAVGLNAIDMSTSSSASEERGARGSYSFAMGENTEASGEWSMAMGKLTKALGSYSTAMGDGSIAKGTKSTALGFISEANGFSTTAMGFGTKADGYYSTAIGFRTISGSYAATSIGHYNIGASGNTLAWEPTDPLFEIGNGEFDARRNALTVLKNGNMGIGNITPTTTLDVDGNIRSRDLAGGGNVIADADGNLVIGAGGGGSSLWTQDGDDIKYTLGNVAIGDVIPIHEMQIHGKSARSNLSFTHLFTGETFDDGLLIGISGVNDFLGFDAQIMNKELGTLSLGTNGIRAMTIGRDGNIGMGTTIPAAKLEVIGDIKTSGEVHGPATGTANMIPIAYGTVYQDRDTPPTGSGNFRVLTGDLPGYYAIRIDDENYTSDSYHTIATIVDSAAGFITVFTGTGALSIQTKNTSGVNTQLAFSFVTYKH